MTDPLELGFSPTVYSLFYPQVQVVIDRLTQVYPHEMYMEAWTKKQDVMHEEFLQAWQLWARPSLPNINWANEFPHSYPCNGSSEAIRESLAQYAADCAVQNRRPQIHVFKGEYEGYRAIAEGYNIAVAGHSRDDWESLTSKDRNAFYPGDCFYLSHPSALDGNIWEHADEFLRSMAENHPSVKIRLDLCYLGCTTKDFVLKNAGLFNVDMIFFSLSKVFGVYYHRIGGVSSKRRLPGLFGNKWFKNLFSLKLGTALLKEFSPRELPEQHATLQAEAVHRLRRSNLNCCFKDNIEASDVVLLAYAKVPNWQKASEGWEHLRRADFFRYCLTPYMGRRLGR